MFSSPHPTTRTQISVNRSRNITSLPMKTQEVAVHPRENLQQHQLWLMILMGKPKLFPQRQAYAAWEGSFSAQNKSSGLT